MSEYEVYTRFNDIVADCTAVYISHRLSSCRFCDEIAVFHQGNVIEQDTHEALLEKGGNIANYGMHRHSTTDEKCLTEALFCRLP